MNIPSTLEQPMAAAVLRLNALAPLDADALQALQAAVERPRKYRAKRELLPEGENGGETLLILDGWAARQHIFEDGRRQIIDMLLPGDLVGPHDCDHAVASSSVVALTDVDTCLAPDPQVSPTLARAYALSRALAVAHVFAQVTRLGRMNAQDRVADLLLEFLGRLEDAGLAADGRYVLPLTQEMLADALGLTSVHVNRTLQALRREGAINLKGHELILPNPAALRRSIGREPARVTSEGR